jgi:hypothetical protein
MWGAIIAGVATIVVVLYMQGPIVALTLTAASSLALLVAMKTEERRMRGPRPQTQPLQVVDGKTKEDIDLGFPPLRQKAS